MRYRVLFPKNNQKKLIKSVKKIRNITWKEFAKILNIKEQTLRVSYKYEKCSLPYVILRKICKLLNKEEKEILIEYEGRIIKEEKFIGRKMLGEKKKKLEKIKINFINTNVKLDTSIINYSKYDIKKEIRLPEVLSPNLAEEIGMHLGDGFLSKKRYDYRMKGNAVNEREYYERYIRPLFKELYNLNINLKDYHNCFGFEISSKALWEFKTKILCIKAGNKENLKLPKVLKINNEEILCSFIRGLFDTDGSLSFKTKYGYKRYYPTIELTLISKNLIKEVGEILEMLGFNPKIYYLEKYGRIVMNGIGAFKKYEELIGWSSYKNLNRVQNWKDMYPKLDKS